jgi:hypothetical protein
MNFLGGISLAVAVILGLLFFFGIISQKKEHTVLEHSVRSHIDGGELVFSNGISAGTMEYSVPPLEQESQEKPENSIEKMLIVTNESFSAGKKKTRNEIIIETAEKWQMLFGRVDFSKEPLFNSMAYLHPQPSSYIQIFEDVTLSENIKRQHFFWLNMFLKNGLRDKFQSISPTGYYLNEGREEPSFLFFETAYDGNELSLIENGNLVFLSIKPKAYNPTSGVSQEFLSTFFADHLNLGTKEEGESVVRELSFPRRMTEGYIFFCRNAGDFLKYRDWRDQIIGFVGKNGVNIILFKTNSEDKTRLGIQYDFDWLNKGLLKGDRGRSF